MTDWTHAACVGRPDLPWTTDYDAKSTMGAVVIMVAVCVGCPAQLACAALGRDQLAGFWAGKYRDAPAEVSLGSEPVQGRTAGGAHQIVLVLS